MPPSTPELGSFVVDELRICSVRLDVAWHGCEQGPVSGETGSETSSIGSACCFLKVSIRGDSRNELLSRPSSG